VVYLTWIGMGAAGGVAVLAARLSHPEYFKPLLPPQRERAVPWTGIELILIVVFCYLTLYGIVFLGLNGVGFFRWIYGVSATSKDAPLERMYPWAHAIAMPLELLFMAALLGMRGETAPYQLGLTPSRCAQNVILGYLGWLVLTPVVMGLSMLVDKAFAPEKHPVYTLLMSKPSRAEWTVIFFLVIVHAPVMEEILFRGLLQRWFMRRSWGPDLALALSFLVALTLRSQDLETALRLDASGQRWHSLAQALAPAAFVLAMIPGYIYCEVLAWRWLPYSGAGRAIYATSLLFAACHSAVWPSPIPLFVLGLGLGFLSYRTQSLIPSITMHALFNTVSCIALLFVPAENQEKGNDEISALRRSSPTATSTEVPGASVPRRTYASAMAEPSRGE
jgi:membrane protease YdiL (CAAX protease family)